MAEFVNKVKKNDVEYEIRDARIEELSDVVSLNGTSLVISEQPGPTPVINIDGVNYYHKQEFDLEELALVYQSEYLTHALNLLTGETETSVAISGLQQYPHGQDKISIKLLLKSEMHGSDISSVIDFIVYQGTGYVPANYSSRELICVDTMEEVTDNTKICLPTCSRYYGYLSEDGKTFISYYNLKDEGAPSKVDSVKQGSSVIPLVDERLPEASVFDEGKTLSVDASGNYQLATASAGGTQLYRHVIEFSNMYLYVIATTSTAATSYSGSPARFDNIKFSDVVSVSSNQGLVKANYYMNDELLIDAVYKYQSESNNFIRISPTDFVSDTVTPL